MKKKSKKDIATLITRKAFKKPGPELANANDAEIADWVRATVHEMDQGGEMLPDYRVAAVMVASTIVGADDERIARLLGYSVDDLADWAKNLRAGGVWKGKTVCDDRWFDPESGLVGFLADSMVAQGLIERREHSNRAPTYELKPGIKLDLN